MQSNELRNGIVRILKPSGKTVGTGFIISTQLIATCAHVIKFAGAKPSSSVRCKRLVDEQEFEALVEEKYWRDPEKEDVAFLRVKEPFPDGIPLTLGTSANISDHSFYSYGFPEKLSRELPVRGTVLCETVDGDRLVLRSTDIVEGVSGAPVIDEQTHLIVGMVVERIKPEVSEEDHTITFRKGNDVFKGTIPIKYSTGRVEDFAYAIPSSILLEICSELSIEYTCPYLGLSAFTENEERFFYGRDKLVERLVKKLLPGPEFLAVVGSSGSGKSSVVQAGLFPKLRRGELLGFPPNVPIFKLRPSNKDTPEKSLLAAFFSVKDSESEESGDVWARVQDYLKQQSSCSIIFIDQFEELFALFQKKQEAFTRGLYNLVKAVSHVTLIITIRSDFYEPLQNSALGQYLPRYQENVPTGFDDEDLRTIITEPAKKVGLKLENGLEELILTDLKQTKNLLPLLEFTLKQLWEAEHKNNLLTRECYLSDRIGRVTGAIAQWANETYRNLKETEKALARQIFTRLIHYGSASPHDKNSTDVPDTRCRLPFTELISSGEESSVVRSLINKLADVRLLVTDDHTVEIIHDALITEWAKLREWVNKKRAFWFWRQQRLDESLREWLDNGKKKEYLLYEAAEGEAEGYLNNDEYRADLNEDERNYIEESVKERDRQIREKQEQIQRELEAAKKLAKESEARQEAEKKARQEAEKREEQQNKDNKKLRRRAIFLGIVSVIAFITAGFAFYQQRQAELNLADSLARYSLSLFAEGKELDAFVEAIQAGKILQQHKTTDLEVIRALSTNIYEGSERDRLQGDDEWVYSVSFSPDGQTLASSSLDSTIERWIIKLWNLETGEEIRTLQGHHLPINSISFSPDGQTLASSSDDMTIKLWNLETGDEIYILKGHDGDVTSVSFSPNGQTLASGSWDSTIKLWNLETGEEIYTLQAHNVLINSISFSPNGQTLASGSNDMTIKLWDLGLDSLMARSCDRVRNYLKHNPNVREENRHLCDGIGTQK